MSAQNIAFILSAPRSGSTWLAGMLADHPQVSSPLRMGLFLFLHDWSRRWKDSLAWVDDGSEEGRMLSGLVTALTQEDFDSSLKYVADRAYERSLAAKPGATVVLDKRSEYVFWTDEIVDVFPRARFIHLIRDGRDVSASLMAAAQGWGKGWAPRKGAGAAELWRNSVETGFDVRNKLPHYCEVRYEEILSDGPKAMGSLFEFLELDPTPAPEIYERFQMQRLRTAQAVTLRRPFVWAGEARRRRESPHPEPQSLFGPAKAGGWDTRLSADDKIAIEEVAGSLLRSLGYAQDPDWVDVSTVDRVAHRLRQGLRGLTVRARRARRRILQT